MDFGSYVCMALVNREITHSSFRLYAVLALGLAREPGFSEIDVESLKAAAPGVRGKPLSEGTLRESLRELERAGLIEMTGRKWSKYRIHVRLVRPQADPLLPAELRSRILVPEGETWGPDSWRSPA